MKEVFFNNRELYLSLFINSVMPIILTDKEDRILDANRRFCSLLGFSREELQSMSLSDIVPDNVKSKGKSVILSDIEKHKFNPFETVDISKNGKQIPVEVTVLPVKSGRETLYFSIINEIKERKETEKKLKQSEKRYRNVFENAGISIWEEDFTLLLEKLDKLRESGVTDLREYLNSYPDFAASAPALIKVININNETVKMLGASSRKEVLGSLEKFFNKDETDVIKEEMIAIWEKRPKFISEITFRSLQGISITVLMNIKFPRKKADFKHVIVSFMDITKLKKVESSLKSALDDKKILLKELHHRTKNNMQMIGSLLTLKTAYTNNENVVEVFNDMKNRIHSMSLVHEKLYQSESLYSIHLNDYIEDIVDTLKNSYLSDTEKISIRKDLEDISVSIDKAIPIGIILNELLANVFKYAFPNGMEGEVKISLHRIKDNYFRFILSDNGTGVPKGFDFRNHESLGMKLIFSIAEEQLKGNIKYSIGKGITWELNFQG